MEKEMFSCLISWRPERVSVGDKGKVITYRGADSEKFGTRSLEASVKLKKVTGIRWSSAWDTFIATFIFY